MNKIKYVIMFFLIHINLLAIEIIDDCQYNEKNILDLHFVIEHPIIGTETLINLSCFTKIKRMHCSGIQLNLNMLLNGHFKDGDIKHMIDIDTVFKKNKILINDKSNAFIIDLKTNNIFWTKENHTTQSICEIK
jgi:hypothetical protein